MLVLIISIAIIIAIAVSIFAKSKKQSVTPLEGGETVSPVVVEEPTPIVEPIKPFPTEVSDEVLNPIPAKSAKPKKKSTNTKKKAPTKMSAKTTSKKSNKK